MVMNLLRPVFVFVLVIVAIRYVDDISELSHQKLRMLSLTIQIIPATSSNLKLALLDISI